MAEASLSVIVTTKDLALDGALDFQISLSRPKETYLYLENG